MQRLDVNVETGEETVVDLTSDEIAAMQATNTPPVPLIAQLWAIRTVLHNTGYFDQFQAAIDASTDVALKNFWQYGTTIDRSSAIIDSLATSLGFTSEQVDQLFRDADAVTL